VYLRLLPPGRNVQTRKFTNMKNHTSTHRFAVFCSDNIWLQASLNIQGASVNRAILQHCIFWFGNTGANFAFNVLN
jgi:hypothetical protein